MRALPALLFSGETMIRLVRFNVQQVQHDVYRQGATKRRGREPQRPSLRTC
jgi:hypothetical protein